MSSFADNIFIIFIMIIIIMTNYIQFSIQKVENNFNKNNFDSDKKIITIKIIVHNNQDNNKYYALYLKKQIIDIITILLHK